MGRHMDRRRFLAGVGLFTAGGAAGGGLVAEPGFAAEGPTARTSAPSGPGAYAATVTFRTSPSARLAALTVDDGPTREWTPRVLAILQRHGAKATFFRVGQRAQAAPDLVRQTADAGHEQGNHTWAHDDLTQHDAAFARGSLERTHELLAELTGRTPTLCRPPYGRIDSVGLAVCAGLRYGVTLWSQHVTGSKPHGDVDTILRRVSPGSIVLTHDGGREPDVSLMTQLDRLVASMTDRGYRFVTVSELLSAPVQGGVNHSRLHSQFRQATVIPSCASSPGRRRPVAAARRRSGPFSQAAGSFSQSRSLSAAAAGPRQPRLIGSAGSLPLTLSCAHPGTRPRPPPGQPGYLARRRRGQKAAPRRPVSSAHQAGAARRADPAPPSARSAAHAGRGGCGCR